MGRYFEIVILSPWLQQSIKNLGSYTHHGRSLCSQLCCMLVTCHLWLHCHHLLRLSGRGLSIIAVAAVL